MPLRREQNTEELAPSDPCTLTMINLMRSPRIHSFSSPALWTKCSILLTVMSS